MSNNGTLVRNLIRGGSGGGSATEVALLSVTTAPSGSFAVGSKYYDLATKKIVTAITADTWTGATSADPVAPPTYYLFGGATYYWDGDSLEVTDISGLEKIANKTDSYSETSSTKYPSSKALSDGLASVRGEIFDIVIESERTTKPGRAGLFSDTVNPLAKADVPLAYAKALDGYNNAEQEFSGWTNGIERTGGNVYGGIGYNNGNYYIGQDSGLFYTDNYKTGTLTSINNSATVDVFCGANILLQRTINGINKIDYATKTTTVLLSELTTAKQGTMQCFLDNGYIYFVDAYHQWIYRILDSASASPELLITHSSAVYSMCKKGTTFYILCANGLFITTDFITLTLKYSYTAIEGAIGGNIFYNSTYDKFLFSLVENYSGIAESTDDCDTFTVNTSLDMRRLEVFGAWMYENTIYFGDTFSSYRYAVVSASNISATIPETLTNNTPGWLLVRSGEKVWIGGNETYIRYNALIPKVYTDTIKGITISYYLAPSGQKICLPTQNTALASLYALTGDNSYLVLDTTGETLQLYRHNVGYEYMIVDETYIDTLTNDVPQERYAKMSDLAILSYSQLENKTIVSTVTETSLLNTTVDEFKGTNVVSANSLNVGDKIQIRIRGSLGTASSAPTNTVKVKFGTVELVSDAKQITADLSNCYFRMEIDVLVKSIGANGSLVLEGDSFFKDKVNFSGGAFRPLSSEGAITVNTTTDNAIDVTYTWGASDASNTITSRMATIKVERID